MSLKVGILMGGPSEEREVSIHTGKAVADACKSNGYITKEFLFQNDYRSFLKDLKDQEIIFNALHGGIGENGKIQEWMDKHKIRYTGSGPAASASCMDKAKSKEISKLIGMKTSDWEILISKNDLPTISLPYVIKPNDQGSTVGLTIVHKDSEIKSALIKAFQHGNVVMVEKYISGRELTVTILGGKAYPIIEIKPSHELYDYECKYTKGMSEYFCPADLSEQLAKSIQNDTELIFEELNCNVYARADYLMDEIGDYYFLEMNTLPGMTSTSLVPKSVKVAGMSFEDLVKNIIELSL